jgi:septum formation protein
MIMPDAELRPIDTRSLPSARMPDLILASTSTYRRELLGRLRIDFRVAAPGVDETPLPGETPLAASQRLAMAKACAIAAREPGALVIGSDQTATLDGETIIGKPGTHEAARAQLRGASGRPMRFHTAVAMVRTADAFRFAAVIDTVVRFRRLGEDDIERYLLADRPYDCTGAARVESLGISLIESVESPDPTALIGLPLIAVCDGLASAGVDILAAGRP